MAKSASPSSPISAATRILILHGKDRFLADEHLRVLREALAKAHGADAIDTVRFDGLQGPRIIADILDEARSFGLMQQHKVILVDNADVLLKSSDDDAPAPPPKSAGKSRRGHIAQSPRELLESYAESPSDSATLILRANTWRPGNLDKAVLAIGGAGGSVIKCEAPSAAEAAAWAQKRARSRHQTSIDPGAAAALVNAVGADLGRIDNELEKLALAAGGNGAPITQDLVDSMTGTTRHDEFWSIQQCLLSGNAAEPLSQLRDLVEVSRHDPVPISYAYLEMARKVHTASRLLAENPPKPANSILGALKIWGPGAEALGAAVLDTAKASGGPAAARLFAMSVAADAANKSGLGDPVRNLEVLTIRFTQLAARRRR